MRRLRLDFVAYAVAAAACAPVRAAPGNPVRSPIGAGCRGVPGAYIAFSPDGTRLATCAMLWDVRSRRVLASMGGDRLAFSPDGRFLMTSLSRSGLATHQNHGEAVKVWNHPVIREARLWDARTGKLKAVLRHLHEVAAFAFSPDGTTVVTVCRDPIVRVWNTATGRLRRSLRGHTNGVSAVAFSPDGRSLAIGAQDTTIRLWEPSTGRLARTLRGHERGVRSLDFSPDGRHLVSAGWDSAFRLWDARSGAAVAVGREKNYILDVTFSPDGEWVATYSEGGKSNYATLWAIRRQPGAVVLEQVWHEWNWFYEQSHIAFSPDGKSLVTETGSGDFGSTDTYLLRDTRTRQARWSRIGLDGGVVAFSPDGRLLAVAGPGMGTSSKAYIRNVELWDATDGKSIATLLAERRTEVDKRGPGNNN